MDGEPDEQALRREFREELDVALRNVSYFETYEDVFTADGETHHELWRCYEAEIAEEWPYREDEFVGYESEADEKEKFECVWKPVAELGPEGGEGETLYPGSLFDDP